MPFFIIILWRLLTHAAVVPLSFLRVDRLCLDFGRSPLDSAFLQLFSPLIISLLSLFGTTLRIPGAATAKRISMAHLVWIYARCPTRHRAMENRLTLLAEAAYTSNVRSELAAVLGPVVGTDLESQVEALRPTANNIVGLALVRPRGFMRLRDRLSVAERVAKDYWGLTRYGSQEIFRLDVLSMMMFSLPQNADMLRAGQVPKGMFSSMSNVSRDRLVNEAVNRVGTHVLDAVRQWAVLHAIEFGTLCVGGRVTTVMATMLAPHAHLVASGRWGQWAFPVLVGHPSGGLGIVSVEHWLHGHRRPVEDELLAMLAELQWGAGGLAIIADTLRAHLPAGEVGGDTLAVLRWLESRRDHIVKPESRHIRPSICMSSSIVFCMQGFCPAWIPWPSPSSGHCVWSSRALSC